MPIQWKPFKEMEKHMQLPDVFGREEEDGQNQDWVPFVPTFKADKPAMDIYQDKKNLYVEIPLGAVNPKDVEVYVEDGLLTVKGKSQEKKESKEKDYFRKEIRRGGFQRTVKLPTEVKENKTEAESEGNILKITLPKAKQTAEKSKKVPVRVK